MVREFGNVRRGRGEPWKQIVIHEVVEYRLNDSLGLTSEFNRGGRDSLIVGCYTRDGVEPILTHDSGFLKLGRLKFRGRHATFIGPLTA